MQESTAIAPSIGTPVFAAPSGLFGGAGRTREWARAFDQWLAELPSHNTRYAYERAWRDLLEHCGKPPWAIQSRDLREWIHELETRPLDATVARGLKRKGQRSDRFGYAPATINQYLSAISSFYIFTMERYLITDPEGRGATPDQGERPLHDGVNPVRAVRRPRVSNFGKADYLDAEAMTAILHAIPRDALQGLRDLALFLGYMLTGRRNSEWRELRWGDLNRRGGKVYHVWSGKGKEDERHELPPPVWDAVQEYLKVAGRLDGIQGGDYIFTPLNDVATRLPGVSERTWDTNRPLSVSHVNNLLKKYARRAQLDPTRISVHTLRHSFAMLLNELGADVLTISKRLAHSNLNITQIYLDHMRGVEDHIWRQAAAALKLDLL